MVWTDKMPQLLLLLCVFRGIITPRKTLSSFSTLQLSHDGNWPVSLLKSLWCVFMNNAWFMLNPSNYEFSQQISLIRTFVSQRRRDLNNNHCISSVSFLWNFFVLTRTESFPHGALSLNGTKPILQNETRATWRRIKSTVFILSDKSLTFYCV